MAVSDELGLFAHTRPAIHGGRDTVIDAVVRLVEAEGIDEVIVGLPLTLAGGESDQTRSARAFARALRARLAVPVTERDERLTTAEASRTVRGKGRRERGDLDSAAAAVLLQSVLDGRRPGTAP
ncbi:MAG: hypothetical protein Kow0010_22180 [Dehalococcoidia bacterium]